MAKPDSAAKIFSALGPPSLASSAEGRPFGITLAHLVYRWAGMLLSEAGKLVGARAPHTANGKPHAAFLTAAPPGATIVWLSGGASHLDTWATWPTASPTALACSAPWTGLPATPSAARSAP